MKQNVKEKIEKALDQLRNDMETALKKFESTGLTITGYHTYHCEEGIDLEDIEFDGIYSIDRIEYPHHFEILNESMFDVFYGKMIETGQEVNTLRVNFGTWCNCCMATIEVQKDACKSLQYDLLWFLYDQDDHEATETLEKFWGTTIDELEKETKGFGNDLQQKGCKGRI